MIADHQKALRCGAHFGGEHSGVNGETQDAAGVRFLQLRRSPVARAVTAHTPMLHRYERGVDPALQHAGGARATRLLLDIYAARQA